MTREELTTRILRSLNDSPTSPVFWSLSEIQGYVTEAQETLAEEAPAFTRTFVLPRRPGTTIYQLEGVGTSILAPYRIWLPDLKRRLEPKTLADLDGRHERWWEVTGEPWYWAPVSWDAFLIWPAPTTGEGWLEVNCYVWPDALLDDDDEPDLHASSHEGLCLYGEALGLLKQWDAQGCTARLQAFFARYGHMRSQAGVNQFQEQHWVRGRAR